MDFSLQPSDKLIYKGRQELPAIQMLKLVAALFVVQIHTESAIREYLMPLCRMAVPLFFMISGYFLVSDNGTLEAPRLRRAFVKVLKLTLAVNVIYFIWRVILSASHGFDFLQYAATAECWTDFLLTGRTFGIHLWYLTAYLQSLALFYVAVRLRMENLLLWLVPVCIAVNIALGSYHSLFFDGVTDEAVHRNFFTIALPCFGLGVLFRRCEHRLPSVQTLLTCAALLLALMITERLLLGGEKYMHGDIALATIPMACVLFALCLCLSPVAGAGMFSSLGRNYSLDIYVYHVMAYNVIQKYVSTEYAAIYTLLAIVVTAVIIAGKQTSLRMVASAKSRIVA
ncbi:MAG: acyltransferase [Bacteroidales bacterium]|nr:acyltransferase [Bacteroidales bacterium]